MVEVRYFAALADAVGKRAETVELPSGATVADLRARLAASYGPEVDRLLELCVYLLGEELTKDSTHVVPPRVDILPPFAGG